MTTLTLPVAFTLVLETIAPTASIYPITPPEYFIVPVVFISTFAKPTVDFISRLVILEDMLPSLFTAL